MKKRMLLLTLLLCLGLTIPAAAADSGTSMSNPYEHIVTTDSLYHAILWAMQQSFQTDASFADVDEASPYRDAIIWAMRNNITAGYEDFTFRPNNDCTRAQIAAFLWRTAGRPVPASSFDVFSDVTPSMNADFYDGVRWLAGVGVAEGESVFDPGGICTRLTAVEFLWYAAGCPEATAQAGFFDIAGSAAVDWAVSKGITGGYEDGTFRPDEACTRGQIVTFLYRAGAETFQ